MPKPAPHAHQVAVRELATGRVLHTWPVDARELVNQPGGGYEYAPEEQAPARERVPQPEQDSASFLESRVKARETLEAKSYKELQALATKVGVASFGVKASDLVDAIMPHVEGGAISLEDVQHFVIPNAQFPNAAAPE